MTDEEFQAFLEFFYRDLQTPEVQEMLRALEGE